MATAIQELKTHSITRVSRPKELLREALESVPTGAVSYGNLRFVANGIAEHPSTPEEINTYLAECARFGVRPFTITHASYYNSFSRSELDKDKSPRFSSEAFPPLSRLSSAHQDAALDAIVRGGRDHVFEIDFYEKEKSFDEIRTGLMKTLLENGYEISRGKLEFSFAGGDFERSTADLLFRSGDEPLRLHITNSLPDNRLSKLTSWFDALKAKYQ